MQRPTSADLADARERSRLRHLLAHSERVRRAAVSRRDAAPAVQSAAAPELTLPVPLPSLRRPRAFDMGAARALAQALLAVCAGGSLSGRTRARLRYFGFTAEQVEAAARCFR